ncbi:MAG: rsmC [Phenylobacterium sp.]|jgi:SAM-dependent methyltransferase|nr:rsmC [Phenylobacterium sp.]
MRGIGRLKAALWEIAVRRLAPRPVSWSQQDRDSLHWFDEPRLPLQPHGLAVPAFGLREAAGTGELDMFLGIGDSWAHLANAFLPPDPVVLDIGCGCGKMARFLALNPSLRYVGVDVFEPSILWCRRAFERYADRFRFEHLDVHSQVYNPQGRLPASEARLPVADRATDLVICGSLFTHLHEPDARRYLGELARVLSDRGGALVSLHVEPPPGQAYAGDEWRIDVDEAYFLEMARAAGLAPVERIGKVYGQTVHLLGKA